jgi:hypothetical protein
MLHQLFSAFWPSFILLCRPGTRHTARFLSSLLRPDLALHSRVHLSDLVLHICPTVFSKPLRPSRDTKPPLPPCYSSLLIPCDQVHDLALPCPKHTHTEWCEVAHSITPALIHMSPSLPHMPHPEANLVRATHTQHPRSRMP